MIMSVILSSGKHAKLTTDPKPWVHDCGDAGCDIAGKHYADRTETDILAGHPEFDRPLANPANPILVELRKAFNADIRRRELHVSEKLRELDYEERFGDNDWSPQQIDHARAVLTRLANLGAIE